MSSEYVQENSRLYNRANEVISVGGSLPKNTRFVAMREAPGTGTVLRQEQVMGGGSLVLRPLLPPERGRAWLDHVFDASKAGHVAPTATTSEMRFLRLFQDVASNPANLRLNPPGDLLKPPAVHNGSQAYTWTARNSKQVWVFERNGKIYNVGVNAAGAHR